MPDPVLRQKAKRVTKIDGALERLIEDMIDTMHAAAGIGLAANQVGVPRRLLVIQIPGEGVITLVNPRINRHEGERLVDEGCLSVPGYRGELMRYVKVWVEGLDRTGKEVRDEAEDLLAQAFQHEVDHLNGILYIDRLEGPHRLQRVHPGHEEEAHPLDELRASSEPVEVPPGRDGGAPPDAIGTPG